MDSIKRNFETTFTGWAFISAFVLLWFGWMLLPHHIGEYIVDSDFSAVGENLWFWIWMYRIHIFGWVTMGISMFAFVSLTSKKPFRILMAPGAGMVLVGTFTLALANAYYYNHGAWGVGQTEGLTVAELEAFMENLLFTNQYVTCFVRFGRIFSGVGMVLLGAGFIKWNMLPKWLSVFTLIFGLAAMGVILLIPDNFEVYKPLFHIKSLWLLLMGIVILRQGVRLETD